MPTHLSVIFNPLSQDYLPFCALGAFIFAVNIDWIAIFAGLAGTSSQRTVFGRRHDAHACNLLAIIFERILVGLLLGTFQFSCYRYKGRPTGLEEVVLGILLGELDTKYT